MARKTIDLSTLTDKERERTLKARERAKAWALANPERKRAQDIARYARNREKDIARATEWNRTNKDHVRDREALKRAEDPEKYRSRDNERRRRENAEKPDQARARRKRWADAHPEEQKAAIKRWNTANRQYINDKKKARILTDVEFRLSLILRARVRGALNKGKRAGHPIRDLGCTLSELRAHLEAQWVAGMSWANYGSGVGKWSVDHRRPLASFTLSDREDFLAAAHFSNLQPMWFVENNSKGARYIP